MVKNFNAIKTMIDLYSDFNQKYGLSQKEKQNIHDEIIELGYFNPSMIAKEYNTIVVVVDYHTKTRDFYFPQEDQMIGELLFRQSFESKGESKDSFIAKERQIQEILESKINNYGFKYLEIYHKRHIAERKYEISFDFIKDEESYKYGYPDENSIVLWDNELSLNSIEEIKIEAAIKEEILHLTGYINSKYRMSPKTLKNEIMKNGGVIDVPNTIILEIDKSFYEGSRIIFPKGFEVLENSIPMSRFRNEMNTIEYLKEERRFLYSIIEILESPEFINNNWHFAIIYKFMINDQYYIEFKESDIPEDIYHM